MKNKTQSHKLLLYIIYVIIISCFLHYFEEVSLKDALILTSITLSGFFTIFIIVIPRQIYDAVYVKTKFKSVLTYDVSYLISIGIYYGYYYIIYSLTNITFTIAVAIFSLLLEWYIKIGIKNIV